MSKEQCGWPFSDSATPEARSIRAVHAKRIEETTCHLIWRIRALDTRPPLPLAAAQILLTAECTRGRAKG